MNNLLNTSIELMKLYAGGFTKLKNMIAGKEL